MEVTNEAKNDENKENATTNDNNETNAEAPTENNDTAETEQPMEVTDDNPKPYNDEVKDEPPTSNESNDNNEEPTKVEEAQPTNDNESNDYGNNNDDTVVEPPKPDETKSSEPTENKDGIETPKTDENKADETTNEAPIDTNDESPPTDMDNEPNTENKEEPPKNDESTANENTDNNDEPNDYGNSNNDDTVDEPRKPDETKVDEAKVDETTNEAPTDTNNEPPIDVENKPNIESNEEANTENKEEIPKNDEPNDYKNTDNNEPNDDPAPTQNEAPTDSNEPPTDVNNKPTTESNEEPNNENEQEPPKPDEPAKADDEVTENKDTDAPTNDDNKTNETEQKADDTKVEEKKPDLEELYKTLVASESKSMLKKYLTKSVYSKLKNKKTQSGLGLDVCIRYGVDNLDSSIGVYASDIDAYDVYKELFNPIIKRYHGIPNMVGFKHPQSNFEFDDDCDADLDPSGKFVKSTKISITRNIEGYPLRLGMNKEQLLDVESKVKEILEGLDGDLKGKYVPLSGMDEDTTKQLIEEQLLFKKGDKFSEFWPEGRGIFFNKAKTFLVWINEEDQLKIMSMEKNGNIKAIFGRLKIAMDIIAAKFVFNAKFGYVSSCPSNLGSGEQVSVQIKIPLITKNKDKFKELCDQYNIEATSEGEGGLYNITNHRKLGVTEFDAVKDVITGIKALIDAETKLPKKKGKKKKKKNDLAAKFGLNIGQVVGGQGNKRESTRALKINLERGEINVKPQMEQATIQGGKRKRRRKKKAIDLEDKTVYNEIDNGIANGLFWDEEAAKKRKKEEEQRKKEAAKQAKKGNKGKNNNNNNNGKNGNSGPVTKQISYDESTGKPTKGASSNNDNSSGDDKPAPPPGNCCVIL